ncbi:MAG: hypothetical protein WDN08_18760 [Rhizomicrobium sp.]
MLIANVLIALALVAALLGGLALFWIARQDDSRTGRLLGLLAMAAAVAAFLYLHAGAHWL